MSADTQLKSYVDRVLRLKEEQDTLGDDIREIYAEAKAEGYDKTIMGKLVAHLRKIAKSGRDAVSEEESVFETYLTAYNRASGMPIATHTHEVDHDPITGEVHETSAKLIATVATGLQTETGRQALITALDIMIEREEAEEQNSPETANEVSPPLAPTRGEEGDLAMSQTRSHEQAAGRPPESQTDEIDNRDSLERQAPRFERHKQPLRPHCRRQDNCGGYGSTHCSSCLRASEGREVSA